MTVFIPWSGGECPVDPLSLVYVKTIFDEKSGNACDDQLFIAQELDWFHVSNIVDDETEIQDDFNIIAYSPAKCQPVFLNWNGGANPAPGNKVYVIFRDSTTIHEAYSEMFDWSHIGDDSDIVTYAFVPSN